MYFFTYILFISPTYIITIFALNGQLLFKEIKNEKMISFLFSDLFYISNTFLSFV